MEKALTIFLGLFWVMAVVTVGQEASDTAHQPLIPQKFTVLRMSDGMTRDQAFNTLQKVFSQLDQGTLDVIESFSSNPSIGRFNPCQNDHTHIHVWKGKDDVTKGIREWYETRGDLTEPTKFDLVNFVYPYAWVKGVTNFMNEGPNPFDQIVVFEGRKILWASTLSQAALSLTARTPRQTSDDVIHGFFNDFDTGNVSTLEELFPERLDVTFVSRAPSQTVPVVVTAHDISKLKQIFLELQTMHWADTVTKVTIQKENFPYVKVTGTMENKSDSRPLASINGIFSFSQEDDKSLKVGRVFCIINWTDEVKPNLLQQA